MEHAPQHHREGIQNELDKAYDEGHRDNEAIDEASVKDEGATHISDEEMQSQFSAREKVMVAGEENEISPELAKAIARLKEAGYLDTSFEGKESHRLEMRALSKEEAIEEYKNSGDKTWVWNELEKNMPYTTPKTETLDVMIMNFGENISYDDALAEMNKLDVRPLNYEELIQYGIVNPEHQKQKVLFGLSTKHTLGGGSCAPSLAFDAGARRLGAGDWGYGVGVRSSFPVVRK